MLPENAMAGLVKAGREISESRRTRDTLFYVGGRRCHTTRLILFQREKKTDPGKAKRAPDFTRIAALFFFRSPGAGLRGSLGPHDDARVWVHRYRRGHSPGCIHVRLGHW